MNWKINILLVTFFCCLSCKKEQKEDTSQDSVSTTEIQLGNSPLVEAESLLKAYELPHLKIIDFRKKEVFAQGHIPNAIQIWRNNIEDTLHSHKGIMAKKESIENLFSLLGISNSDTLILYDDRGSCDAARLWWALKSYGFENIKILNGGIQAWTAAGGEKTKRNSIHSKTNFKLPQSNSMRLLINKEELSNALRQKKPITILDTRTEDEFTGKRQKLGASKAGRIVDSKLLDWANTIDYHNSKKFKSISDLEKLYAKLEITKDDQIVTYCHSGVRSAHTTFILTELLGYKNVKNYDGSWIEWSYYNDLPFEKDSITVILQ